MLDFATSRCCVVRSVDKRLGLRRLLARLGAIALLACLTIGVARATDQPATLQVSVIDEKNQPVADANVTVTLGDKQITSSATDATGKANLVLPASGTYLLNITKTGYLNSETSVDATASPEAQSVDVVLNSVALSQQIG